jgi:hypothetical protein|tara:strand:- start:35 stop:274 length:240 start_codon:yes stop_codon:yes gene_type:complete
MFFWFLFPNSQLSMQARSSQTGQRGAGVQQHPMQPPQTSASFQSRSRCQQVTPYVNSRVKSLPDRAQGAYSGERDRSFR